MKKRFTEEQVIRILREAEAPGVQIREVCRRHNVTEQPYFRWRRKFGGREVPDARKLKALEALSSRGMSERAACRYLGLSRRVTGYELKQPVKDKRLGERLIESSQELPRCSSDMRLPGATHPNSVWCYDFVHDRFADGRAFRMLCVLDEHTRECLAIEVARSITSQDVILVLSRLMRLYRKPAFIRSDPGTEFTAGAVMRWLRDQSVGPAFIPPGRPWHNGFVERFNGKLRDECLNREWFRDLREARMLIEQWREFYNHRRPHSSLGNRTPVQARHEALKMEPRLTA